MTDTARSTPNQKLRYERERRCWSQQELADMIGTTPLNIGRWERGVTLPGPHFRQKLCELFEKNAQQLGLVPESANNGKAAETGQSVHISEAFSQSNTPPSLWNVPYRRNLFFTGREDVLIHLRNALTAALTQPQAISGPGGIGKTQTAIEYAYRYRQDYTAVLWARADSYDLLVSDFLIIAALLNLPERNDHDQSRVINAVIRWFDTHDHWLLILDNADNIEMTNEFIPSASKGHILLTTRAHSTGTIAQGIELEKMDREEGILFLLQRSKRLKGNRPLATISEAIREQAHAIVEAVDGLPLALEQAGAYIEETDCNLTDYLKFYKTRRNRLLKTRGKDANSHPEPVATTWSLSFEKVERTNPAAAELLRLCAFLHPDTIPESMIAAGASELGPVLEPVAKDELELNEAIGELRKYSLVKRDPEQKILNIHRLVQAVLKDGIDKEVQKKWAKRAVRLVNTVFPEVEFAVWARCQQLLPQVEVCRALIEKARIIRENSLGPEHPDVAKSFDSLAWLYLDKGKYNQAELFYQRALTIYEKVFGMLHPDVARSFNALGLLYYNQGKYEQAELLHHQALKMWEHLFGPDHPNVAHTLNGLALLYFAQGKYEQAERHFQRAFALQEQILGLQHPDTIATLKNYANLLRKMDRETEAVALEERVL